MTGEARQAHGTPRRARSRCRRATPARWSLHLSLFASRCRGGRGRGRGPMPAIDNRVTTAVSYRDVQDGAGLGRRGRGDAREQRARAARRRRAPAYAPDDAGCVSSVSVCTQCMCAMALCTLKRDFVHVRYIHAVLVDSIPRAVTRLSSPKLRTLDCTDPCMMAVRYGCPVLLSRLQSQASGSL